MADDGMIRFYCRDCGTRNKVLAKFGGMRARCPKCGVVNEVPLPDEETADDEFEKLADQSGGMSVNADVRESVQIDTNTNAPEDDLLSAESFGTERLDDDDVLEFLEEDEDDEPVFDMFTDDEPEPK